MKNNTYGLVYVPEHIRYIKGIPTRIKAYYRRKRKINLAIIIDTL